MKCNAIQNKDNEENNNKFNLEVYENQNSNQQEENKINFDNIQQIDKIITNKEEDIVIIIELELNIQKDDDKEINILCDIEFKFIII